MLDEEALQEYQNNITLFYDEIVELNTSIFIWEKIDSFPFLLFSNPMDNIFFPSVTNNILDANLMRITRLLTDEGSDLITIPKFKDWIIKHVKTEYIGDFRKSLKALKFDGKTKDVLERIKNIRISKIAHLKKNGTNQKVSLDELKILRDKITDILSFLGFDVELILNRYQLVMKLSTLIEYLII